MEIESYKLLKVDNSTNSVTVENFANDENIHDYIWEIITNCADNEGDREYIFEPTLQTMQNHISNIIRNNNREQVYEQIAYKLLAVENETKNKIAHLNKDIPKGILMISYTKMTNSEYKIIITKADYTEFLEELRGERKSGLPTKKKIFKSFIMNITIEDDGYNIGRIITYDSNTSTKAVYWWKQFLELKEIRDDEKNTISAYNAIKKEILEPIRKKHKQDYLYLRNTTIAYLRGEGEFNINHYKENIIGNYQPFDTSLNMAELKTKINRLPQKYKFDPIFQKRPDVIKDKFKDTIKLTEEIDLQIKQDILNIKRVIRPLTDEEGNEYVMILSPQGYQYAIGLSRNQDE